MASVNRKATKVIINKEAADKVREQRTRVGLTTFPLLYEASGISDATWGPLIRHDIFPPTDHVQRKMSEGIGWTAESFKNILDGGEPELAMPPEEQRGVESMDLRQLARHLEVVATQITRALNEDEQAQ